MNILLCGKVYPCARAPDKERRSHPPLIKKGLSRARQVKCSLCSLLCLAGSWMVSLCSSGEDYHFGEGPSSERRGVGEGLLCNYKCAIIYNMYICIGTFGRI